MKNAQSLKLFVQLFLRAFSKKHWDGNIKNKSSIIVSRGVQLARQLAQPSNPPVSDPPPPDPTTLTVGHRFQARQPDPTLVGPLFSVSKPVTPDSFTALPFPTKYYEFRTNFSEISLLSDEIQPLSRWIRSLSR